jgi:hypothetical protein
MELSADTAAAIALIADAAEQERLIGELAVDGVHLPTRPAATAAGAHLRHSSSPAPLQALSDDKRAAPGGSAVPRFRGPMRRP